MNTPLHELLEAVSSQFTIVKHLYTEPLHSWGVHWLDIDAGTHHLILEWSDATGFGVTVDNGDLGYGCMADERFWTFGEARKRIVEILSEPCQKG